MSEAPARAWEVLLLGGASGVGKSSLAYPLARHFGVALTEVDDFQILLSRMTTPAQLPALHVWRTHPDLDALPEDEIARMLEAYAEALAPGLEAVIENHLESRAPLVLEGDFILPRLAVRPRFGAQANAGRVRGLFLHEGDPERIAANYSARENAGPQTRRAAVSARHSAWLKGEAARCAVPVLDARPRETLLARAITALSA